jgi:GNAT superfamily N-acetyltransferase
MIKHHLYDSRDVPAHLHWQILSFVRIEWPELFSGENRLKDWTSRSELHPVTLLIEEEGVLISRLEVVWDMLLHAGETYRIYGLSGMLTYPAFRKQGYALQLVREAIAYIKQQGDADLVLLHSTLQGFYEKAGFERMERVVTLVGDPLHPEISHETAFMLFLSPRGQQGRRAFETQPVYMGESIW